MIKVFGIGNLLLMDDGIGIRVAEGLKDSDGMRIYITEIFVEDALEEIEEKDYVVIIDAVKLDKKVGEIHFLTFEECAKMMSPQAFCHDMSLLNTLLLVYPTIEGELIGIEIAEINYGEDVSFELALSLSKIIEEVRQHIEGLPRKGANDA